MRPLERYIVKGGQRLRLGYTTGSCAAAAARAAALLLLGGARAETVRITAPGGELLLDIEECTPTPGGVRCTVRKDAGDDPDITDGALVGCTVCKTDSGFAVDGGAGVGRVSKPGLACAVGEAAINPVPRKMILEQLSATAAVLGYTGGLRAVVDVPEGEALARRTFNPRLGIEGGISILGTTGIVQPMSEAALVATIHAEVDSHAAAGRKALLIVPGNYGEGFALDTWGLALDAGVKCSNYLGETLDYAVYQGFRRILLLGHAGKLVKLAAGVMNTHSRVADCRMETLAAHAAVHGVSGEQTKQLLGCATVDAADELLAACGVAETVWQSVAKRAAFHLGARCGDSVETAFAAFARRGIVMRHGKIESIREDLL